jgi:hypothetical protein
MIRATMSSFSFSSFQFRPGGALLRIAPWSLALGVVTLIMAIRALPQGSGMFFSFAAAAGIIALPAALWRYRARARQGGALTLKDGRFQVSGVPERFTPEEVVRAEPRGAQGLFLEMEDGAEIEAALDGCRPDEVLEALRYDPKTRVVRVPRQSFPSSAFFGIVSLLVVPVLVFQPLAALAERLGDPREHVGSLLLACFLVGCAVALLGGKRLERRGFELSLDGIRVRDFLRQRFFPRIQVARFEEIERRVVASEEDEEEEKPLYASRETVELVGFRVHLRSGETLLLKDIPSDRLAQVRGALVRMTARSGKASWEAHRGALARGERDAAAWVQGLQERYRSAANYREDRVPESDLEECLKDPSAPPDLRLAAAVALRAGGKGARKKIRVAAEDCANPELARALLAAREEALDEELVAAVERQAGRG